MTIRLINENLTMDSFNETTRFLEEKLGKKYDFAIVSFSEAIDSNFETLIFESQETVKVYGRSYGYVRTSLKNYIEQKEALYGIH